MSTWKYTDENGEKVSISGGQLKWLAKNGKITPETIIETEDGKTAPARKVKGLTFGDESATEAPLQPSNASNVATPSSEEVYGVQPHGANPFAAPIAKKSVASEMNPFTASFSSVPSAPVTAAPTAKTFCSYCGNGISEHAVVCTACGMTPMGHKRFCRNCGVPLNAEQVICVKCGVSLDGKKLSAPKNVAAKKANTKNVNAGYVNTAQSSRAVPVPMADGEEEYLDANDLGIGFWDVILNKYCMFSGRARRKEYWWFTCVWTLSTYVHE